VCLHTFLTSAADEGEWRLASRPGRFNPYKGILGDHCTGGWVGPRARLDAESNLGLLAGILTIILTELS
jgi:hypothetical protein